MKYAPFPCVALLNSILILESFAVRPFQKDFQKELMPQVSGVLSSVNGLTFSSCAASLFQKGFQALRILGVALNLFFSAETESVLNMITSVMVCHSVETILMKIQLIVTVQTKSG